MKDALRESEEKYRWLIETTDTGYVIVDEQGHVLDANQRYAQLTGRSAVDEVVGRSVMEWTAPHDIERNVEEVRRCVGQGFVRNLEIDYITPDGRVVPVEINATVLSITGALRILCLCRDISERKQAERALRLSEVTYREIFNTVNDAIWVHDLDGRFLDVNDAVTRMFGYSVAEAKGLSVGDISSGVPPYTDDTARERIMKAVAGEPQLFEWQCKHKDGHLFWSEVLLRRGTIAGRDCVLAIERDITARKQAEAALRESEERYRAFVANSSEGICRFEVSQPISTALPVERQVELILQHGYFAECNDALARMYGLERAEQLAGTPIKEFWGGDQKYLAFLERIVRSQYRVVDEESAETVNGAMHYFLNSTIGIVEDGLLVRAWGLQRDITERRRTEEALRASLEEKESLLKEVHHRVKNNLQVISSLLNLQLRKVKNAEVRSFLRDTQNRIRSMAMLHEILYRSNNLADVHFPLYLKHLCDHLARSYDSGARKITLRQEISDIPLDPDQAITAGLIVNELVTNAIKHAFPSGAGGDVIVELRADDEDHLLLRVADNGVGLPPDTPPEAEESLGLLLVESLSRQLNGRLSIGGGPGATFEIVFPRVPRESRTR
jgi:PAS domain S-box-containing protein